MLKNVKKLLRPYATPGLLRTWHTANAVLANLVYGFPGRRLRVVGITGTNGKTTTAHFVAAILAAAGYKTALATTVAFQIGTEREVNALNMTTPSPWVIQKFLARAAHGGAHMAVIETTSHALDQQRVWGIRYDAAILTNLTHDHLDYHGTFEAYRATKLKLFSHMPRLAIINADDPSASFFLDQPAQRHLTYGIDARADVTARKLLLEPTSSLFTAVTPVGQVAINLALPGRFNISNALAAVAFGVAQGMTLETIKQALEQVEHVPGRMERVDVGQDFTVFIDYAHTPDAFQKLYEAVKTGLHGRLIHVFGATGDRDKTKRPIMGALAAGAADHVIVTNDEPYSEDPQKIIDEIVSGLKRGRPAKQRSEIRNQKSEKKITRVTDKHDWWEMVPDRKQAIRAALQLARKDDVVLITGMGDERWMTVSDGQGGLKKLPWNERRIVKDLLLNRLRAD